MKSWREGEGGGGGEEKGSEKEGGREKESKMMCKASHLVGQGDHVSLAESKLSFVLWFEVEQGSGTGDRISVGLDGGRGLRGAVRRGRVGVIILVRVVVTSWNGPSLTRRPVYWRERGGGGGDGRSGRREKVRVREGGKR